MEGGVIDVALSPLKVHLDHHRLEDVSAELFPGRELKDWAVEDSGEVWSDKLFRCDSTLCTKSLQYQSQ